MSTVGNREQLAISHLMSVTMIVGFTMKPPTFQRFSGPLVRGCELWDGRDTQAGSHPQGWFFNWPRLEKMGGDQRSHTKS